MNYIITKSGRMIDPKAVSPADIHIGDIASSLSRLPRFLGHTSHFYSVAEHCVRVSYAVDPRAALHALLHDASEAYFADIPSPLKQLLPEYCEMEKRAMLVIYHSFGVAPQIWKDEVKRADLAVCAAEIRDLMPVGQYGLDEIMAIPDYIVPWEPETAELMFLTRFAALRKEALE
jgi:uncharacterized protein